MQPLFRRWGGENWRFPFLTPLMTCMYACICSVQQANDTCKPSQWNSANLFCATFATASFGSSVAFCQAQLQESAGSIPMLLDVATQPECDP